MSGPPGDEQQGQPSWQQPSRNRLSGSSPNRSSPSGASRAAAAAVAAQTTPGSATASLILGICSLVVCGIICGPLALVYGNKARNEIDASGGRLGGRGMATAGHRDGLDRHRPKRPGDHLLHRLGGVAANRRNDRGSLGERVGPARAAEQGCGQRRPRGVLVSSSMNGRRVISTTMPR